ncbi:hypothetical protein INS49_015430 [Diaporthe citri]|uniref:uncharacterized protein n=1 Tax=Diaporthe citri TaxID=83186 RepID=UPI001C7EC16A|nr:uncharacterized protein INS49_015430 [Diaporthe citri]KAG6356045.1 hypothetical protein INS49_015430 [Diaporthe citri]
MRRSGAPASFHGLMRPNIPPAQSTLIPRHVPRPGPLSLPTPASFNFAPTQSSTIKSQVLSPASSSNSSFSSAPSSIDSFQLPAEVRQSLNRSAPATSDSRPSPPKAADPAVGPQKFIPRFGPAHRLPPESDHEEGDMSEANTEAVIHIAHQPQTFDDRLAQAQEQSQVWGYIKDKLEFANFTCKSEREEGAFLEILRLPKQNELDDEPMRGTDRHKRRYCVIIGSILQVVGVKGHCDACKPHCRIYWQHRQKTCIGLPPSATGPQYRNLIDFVAGRCSNCIRSTYLPPSCHFAAGEAPADAEEEEEDHGVTADHHSSPGDAEDAEVSVAGADPAPGDAFSQNRAPAQGDREPTQDRPSQTPAPGEEKDRPPSAGSKPQAQASRAPDAETIIRDAIVVGFRASTQLRAEEQESFHDWMAALFSLSSSSPDLEGQALEALMRLRQLSPGAQVDIRRRILQMLPGAMGRPA